MPPEGKGGICTIATVRLRIVVAEVSVVLVILFIIRLLYDLKVPGFNEGHHDASPYTKIMYMQVRAAHSLQCDRPASEAITTLSDSARHFDD